MQNNEETEYHSMTPAMAVIFQEMKLIVHMTEMSKENRNKANDLLNSIRDNTRLMASDSFEEHNTGNCHCMMAIDATEELADFLRALKKGSHAKS